MATGLDLSGIQQFKPNEDPASLSNRWTAWLKRFERFVVAMDIKDTTRKRSLLLYLADPEVEKIFETIPDNGEEKDYDVAAKKLTEYFSPKKNTMYEIHLFRKAQQRQGETIDQFYTRLCQLAKTCEFADEKHEIKIQLIERCSSARVRRKALREEALSLDALLKYGCSLEISEHQVGELEKAKQDFSDSINFVNKNSKIELGDQITLPTRKKLSKCVFIVVVPIPTLAAKRHALLSERSVGGVVVRVILKRYVERNTQVSQVRSVVKKGI